MKWSMPPKIKVYEALGAIGDGRIEVADDSAKLYSSSGNKFYTVVYDPETKVIYANDNASYFVGYLGYPAIAYLFAKGILAYNPETAKALSGIAWKDINQKYKNDFTKTMDEVNTTLSSKGLNAVEVAEEVDIIMNELEQLELEKPAQKSKPPKGY